VWFWRPEKRVEVLGHGPFIRFAAICLAIGLAAALLTIRPVLGEGGVAKITSPQSGASVRDVVVVNGTATRPSFSFYKIEVASEPSGNWNVVGDMHSSEVTDGVLGQWDTRSVPDGSYSLRLTVVDASGNYDQDTVRQVVVANAGPSPTTTATPTAKGTTTVTATYTATPGGTLEPTATMEIVVPAVLTGTAPVSQVGAATPARLPTVQAVPTDAQSSSIVDTVRNLLGGIATQFLNALGIDFKGIGSAGLRGGIYAGLAFAAVGALAGVRAILVGLYRLIRR
jgi:hypothetical protein